MTLIYIDRLMMLFPENIVRKDLLGRVLLRHIASYIFINIG